MPNFELHGQTVAGGTQALDENADPQFGPKVYLIKKIATVT
jgi:hypothetical protein